MSRKSRGWSLSQLLGGGDEEMAIKKDDDHHQPKHGKAGGQWQAAPSGGPRRVAAGRFAVYLFILFFVVYLLYNTLGGAPSNKVFLDPLDELRYDKTYRYDAPRMEPEGPTLVKAKPESLKKEDQEETDEGVKETGEEKQEVKSPKTYKGVLKLPGLGASIRNLLTTGGGMGGIRDNRNVMFAAANLQSVALLLPMACQMAAQGQNYVHFAIMSRSEISMQDLLKLNGVDEACEIMAHDARPDHSTISTEARMTLATTGAMYHITSYMHPQAIIIDGSDTEEDYFLTGLRDHMKTMEAPLIEIPRGGVKRLSWLTKLDAAALSAWNEVDFDIVIQAPASGVGNIRRLLSSLAKANLAGITPPHLTVELPPVIDKHLKEYLADYHWPPKKAGGLSHPKMLSLRHRIPREKLTEEESSVRFLESFWPRKPSHSHVLVLSPHTEVAHQFFHYLKYTLLQRRYSAVSQRQDWDKKLFGLSFSSPSTLLDESKPLTQPKPIDSDKAAGESTSYLWEAPDSDAVLIMGDKWVELHGYISQLLEKRHAMSTTPELLAKKQVGKKHPAWLEHALHLSRIRGYVTLYPSQQTSSVVLGVHTDLHDVPEEYEGQSKEEHDPSVPAVKHAVETFDSGSQVDMLATLPNDGELESIMKLPWLAWDGQKTDEKKMTKDAALYRQAFRSQVGGCVDKTAAASEALDPYAKDLFCSYKAA